MVLPKTTSRLVESVLQRRPSTLSAAPCCSAVNGVRVSSASETVE